MSPAPDAERRRYLADAALRQLTGGGNAWGAECVLMVDAGPCWRLPLTLLRNGDTSGCIASLREILD